MLTKKPSSEGLRVAALLIVFLSELILPTGEALGPRVSAAGPQGILDHEMFRVIFTSGDSNGSTLTLGEAVIRAKNSIKDGDVRLTYVLFGDPTSRINQGLTERPM